MMCNACMQVPPADNYFAALNSAVFTDGSFVYIPKGVQCPMELSTYFRINAEETGQVRLTSCIHASSLGLQTLLVLQCILSGGSVAMPNYCLPDFLCAVLRDK